MERDLIARGKEAAEAHAADPDAEPLRTLAWPTLSPDALFGTAGQIVKSVAPQTEADPRRFWCNCWRCSVARSDPVHMCGWRTPRSVLCCIR